MLLLVAIKVEINSKQQISRQIVVFCLRYKIFSRAAPQREAETYRKAPDSRYCRGLSFACQKERSTIGDRCTVSKCRHRHSLLIFCTTKVERFSCAWVKDFPFLGLTLCSAASSAKRRFAKSHAEDLPLRPIITRSIQLQTRGAETIVVSAPLGYVGSLVAIKAEHLD